MQCMWLLLLQCRTYTADRQKKPIYYVLQLRPLPLLRGARVGPKWWFPNLCCEKRPMGGGGPRPGVESEKICSLFPRTLLWRWQLEDHGQDHLENRFTREKPYSTSCTCGFVLRTCDTNIALLPQYIDISDQEVYAAGGNMVSEVLEVGFWLVICWRSIFVHCSKISTSFSWLHRSQTKNQHGRV